MVSTFRVNFKFKGRKRSYVLYSELDIDDILKYHSADAHNWIAGKLARSGEHILTGIEILSVEHHEAGRSKRGKAIIKLSELIENYSEL